MFTGITFIVFCVLILSAGFLAGREYEYEIIMRRLKKVAEEKNVKPCCGNCLDFNGDYCTLYWNNLDECYKDTERDARDPYDEPCDYWRLDESAMEGEDE